MWQKFLNWSASNSKLARCTRTIVHGIVGALITYAADIVASFGLSATECALLTALIMAILSPIQSSLGELASKE
jgi:hypothetical protein